MESPGASGLVPISVYNAASEWENETPPLELRDHCFVLLKAIPVSFSLVCKLFCFTNQARSITSYSTVLDSSNHVLVNFRIIGKGPTKLPTSRGRSIEDVSAKIWPGRDRVALPGDGIKEFVVRD